MLATGDLEKEILVVKRETLFENYRFQGFKPASFADFESIILENQEWMLRRLAEKNPDFKQPIAYVVVVNQKYEQVFVYRRASNGAEQRLQGNWSWGGGGHVESKDSVSVLGEKQNPVLASAFRELHEEVEVYLGRGIDLVGYINDDSTPVGRVHFGVLYVAPTSDRSVSPKGDEFRQGKLMRISDLEKLCASPNGVDGWSRLAVEPIKNYLAEMRP